MKGFNEGAYVMTANEGQMKGSNEGAYIMAANEGA